MDARYARFCRNPADRREIERASAEAAGKALPPRKAAKGSKSLEALGFEKIMHGGGYKLVGPCPACRAEGGDSKGGHLAIFEDGKFTCVRWPSTGDLGQREEHQRAIWGYLKPILKPILGGKLKSLPAPDPAIRAAQVAAIAAAKKAFKGAIEKFSGGLPVLGPSDPIPADPKDHFRIFCRFFRPGDLVWAGERYDCSDAYERHIFTPETWEAKWDQIEAEGLDHTFGFSWKPGSGSRKSDNHAALRFLVVEHDGISRDEQIALIKFVSLKFRLLAVLDTAGKGYHGLFDSGSSSPVEHDRLSKFLSGIGADTNSFSRSATRTPGAVRQATETNPGGRRQLLVWINPGLI